MTVWEQQLNLPIQSSIIDSELVQCDITKMLACDAYTSAKCYTLGAIRETKNIIRKTKMVRNVKLFRPS